MFLQLLGKCHLIGAEPGAVCHSGSKLQVNLKYAAILNLHISVLHAERGWSGSLNSRFGVVFGS